jgi:hypothetical protein
VLLFAQRVVEKVHFAKTHHDNKKTQPQLHPTHHPTHANPAPFLSSLVSPPALPSDFCARYRTYILVALTTAVGVMVGVYLWEYREQYFHLGTQDYGPGDGAWLLESPEVHGLDPHALDAAAVRVGNDLQQRDCLVVVKVGLHKLISVSS